MSSAEDFTASWKEVDDLIALGKLESASKKVEVLLEAARSAGDEESWTRALVEAVQLRWALGKMESGVRFLKEQPWPQKAVHRSALELFYAHSLVNYSRFYSWEIYGRERVESSGTVDLKGWTREQIGAAALAAYREVWSRRGELGTAPVSIWALYLLPGEYPETVRGTLRDAISYLFVELLADSSFWPPGPSEVVDQLALDHLLDEGGNAARADQILASAEARPLAKLIAVLADLEAWHRAAGRREAALEARLERLRRLHSAFREDEERQRIQRALQSTLDANRDLPWWSMGMATLADFLAQGSGPDDLQRAHAAAVTGAAAWPRTPGGLHCENAARRIEAPGFSVEAMASDGLHQRSIQVTHKNLPALYFRAFPLDPQAEDPKDWSTRQERTAALLASGPPAAAWRAELPETPDYRPHTTWITPPIDRPGAYVVLASPREDFALVEDNQVVSLELLLGDLVLVVRNQSERSGLDALALSGRTGQPVSGAVVRAYRWENRRRLLVEERTSGEDGAVHFSVSTARAADLLLGWKGAETAEVDLAGPDKEKAREDRSTLVYTDRAVYRPQQRIFWKVLAYSGQAKEGRFQAAAGEAVTVTLLDPNRQKAGEQTVTTNEFGTASGELTIPAGRLLGSWTLLSRLKDHDAGSAELLVEEYKRPTFEVRLDEPTEPLRLNQAAKLSGQAIYYFGLPVSEGQVRWRILRDPIFPWWWDWRHEMPNFSSRVIASGTAELSPDGSFEVDFDPASDRRADADLTYWFVLSAEVTDGGGETREAERCIRVGQVSIEARIADDAGFLLANRRAALSVLRRDLNGVPRPGTGSWSLYELSQPERTLLPAEQPMPAALGGGFRTPGDELRPRWDSEMPFQAILQGWQEGRRLGGGRLGHGPTGEAIVRLPALPPGAYRLRYETVDDFGARVEARRELIVAGGPDDPTRLALPAVLAVETPKVRVGGTARVLVHSGFPGQTLFFEIDRDGEPIEVRSWQAAEGASVVEIPIGQEHRGGLGLRLLMVRDHQLLAISAAVQVPWEDRELQLAFSSFRDTIRPGARETWRVTVKGAANGKPEAVAAELLASMTDRSLDFFAPNNPPSPLGLYPVRTGVPSLSSGFGVSGAYPVMTNTWSRVNEVPDLRPDRLRFLDDSTLGRLQRAEYGDLQMIDGVATQEILVTAESPRGTQLSVSTSMTVVTKSGGETLPDVPAAPPPPLPPPDVRRNFHETAFWSPHLLTGTDGSASLEFTVPDSVTSWHVWVHALARDFRAGSIHREVRSTRELQVRPYLPRFLREGDRAELAVVVDNATQKEVRGEVSLAVLDPETDADLLADFGLSPGAARLSFAAPAGGSTTVAFPLAAPQRVGTVAFEVTATAGELSDGELRPLPLLPSRIHLFQSRFAMLKDRERRTLRFEDLERDDDPTRIDEQLVVTLDGQLFEGVLAALPYLVNYPYECTEQTLNRFLSTGIVSSLFDRYPVVARLAADLAKRETPLETWDATDPNRKVALEETPFLTAARGGEPQDLIRVLDPRVARAERASALAKLAQAQLPSGAFPWWPGGPASVYMTVYILDGFAKAAEFGVEVPREPVRKGWAYLAKAYRGQLGRGLAEDDSWRILTYLNYVASAYPDPSWMGDALTVQERERLLAESFSHWREHSGYLKGLLALTLKRMGRPDDARLVFDSVLDAARTTPDEGTFWQPEDRSWLWYNDSIESHAFALRVLAELRPDDPRRLGLMQWLFLHKQLNHWKSTRATAEVLYALAYYLQREGQLGVGQAATVRAGDETHAFVFAPDRYTGKQNQVVIPGERIDPARSEVVVEKETPGFLFAAATWHFSTAELPKEDRGDLFQVSRRYFQRVREGREVVLRPLAEGTPLAPGDEVEVQLSLRSRAPAEYVHLRDPRPAGCEPETVRSGWRGDLGVARYEETRDSGANFFFESLPAGEYTFKYRLRANLAGTFRTGPATVQSIYAPEFTAYSAGDVIRIEGSPRRLQSSQ